MLLALLRRRRYGQLFPNHPTPSFPTPLNTQPLPHKLRHKSRGDLLKPLLFFNTRQNQAPIPDQPPPRRLPPLQRFSPHPLHLQISNRDQIVCQIPSQKTRIRLTLLPCPIPPQTKPPQHHGCLDMPTRRRKDHEGKNPLHREILSSGNKPIRWTSTRERPP